MKRFCLLVTLVAILFAFGSPANYAYADCQELYDDSYRKCMDKTKKKFKRLKDGPTGKDVVEATGNCVRKATVILNKCAKLGKPFKKAWKDMEKKRKKCISNHWKACWKEKSGDHLAFMKCIDTMNVKCDWDRTERNLLLQFKSN